MLSFAYMVKDETGSTTQKDLCNLLVLDVLNRGEHFCARYCDASSLWGSQIPVGFADARGVHTLLLTYFRDTCQLPTEPPNHAY